jgi:hypothetical protein
MINEWQKAVLPFFPQREKKVCMTEKEVKTACMQYAIPTVLT